VTGLCLGAILADFVKNFKDLQITAIVRNKNHIKAVSKLGVNVVEGEFSNAELVAKHARTADITINAAGSDDVPLTEAILAGQMARVEEDGKARAALLHTSGVAVFAGEERDGRHYPDHKKWNVCYQHLVL
jgi:putative NADH-flavin reductase